MDGGVEVSRVVSIIGLGYVGLPLAAAFAAKGIRVVGFDIDPVRIAELQKGVDRTGEVSPDVLRGAPILFTSSADDLKRADFHIIAVPTPIDEARRPDLGPLLSASRALGRRLKPGDIVVYESTVYPGCTEDECAPVLEAESGLKLGEDFAIGYSPERINPGDAARPIQSIVKVVSGSDPQATAIIVEMYAQVIGAGLHIAPSIKVAEASKVVENTQRDVNIALMNEFALIFDRLGIATRDVLAAAGTKWNFLPFTPGLVGGHCIGVDPYYLTTKAEISGYTPQVILSGRRINDGMGGFVAQKAIRALAESSGAIKGARVGIMGVAFKENVSDTRNSRVPDIVAELRDFGVEALVHDPLVDPVAAAEEHGLTLSPSEALTDLDLLILAAPHAAFVEDGGLETIARVRPGGAVFDIRAALNPARVQPERLYWSL